MATVTRTHVFVDGDTLTAAQLNTEFNNLLNAPAIVNADISSGAAIAATKIANTAVTLSDNQTISGTNTFSGGNTFSVAQTFSGANIFNAEHIMKQITTPANPSAGNDKLYFKSDDKLYRLNSSGTETTVGQTVTIYKNSTTTGGNTTSGTFSTIPNCSVSVTTTATANVFVMATTTANNTNTSTNTFRIVRDSTAISPTQEMDISGAAGANYVISLNGADLALAAGTYTYAFQFATTANTLTANPGLITVLVIQ